MSDDLYKFREAVKDLVDSVVEAVKPVLDKIVVKLNDWLSR